LSKRDELRRSLEKEDRPGKRGSWRSKAYHRFFEGYTEVTVPNPDGKGSKIQRIYTGNYYRQDLTKHQRILLRLLYVVLYLGAVYLFVSSATLPVSSNSTWYVVLTQVLTVPFLFWILIVFFSYLPASLDMTINDYRSASLALKKATLYSVVSTGMVALATLVFILLNRSDEPLLELLCAVKYLVAGLLLLALNRVEKKVNYLIIPSRNELPSEGDTQVMS
jgi:hypothetical protein